MDQMMLALLVLAVHSAEVLAAVGAAGLPPLLNISLVPSCAAVARAGASPVCTEPQSTSTGRPWPWPHGGAPTVNHSVALGDIRAVVHAEAAGQPLQAQVWWRRRDTHPALKAVIVTTNADVPVASVAVHIEADCGVVSFTPPVAGDYFIYYLPYVQSGQYAGTHFHWFNCTDQSNAPSNLCVIDSLAATAMATRRVGNIGCAAVDAAATARVLRLESRASPLPLQQPLDFGAFHPMELTATKDELASMRSATSGFKIFMEPRENPIRMFSRVPASWARHGEVRLLSTSATAGEYFTFQIGLWASDGDIKDVSLNFGTMTAGAATPKIRPSAFTCFNLGGVTPHGQTFKKNYTVTRGNVGSLWVGVQLPADNTAVGNYTSVVLLSANGETVSLELEVDVALVNGSTAENGGLDDIYKMGRLSWLDSTKGIDETVADGFTPVEVLRRAEGLTVKVGGCNKLFEVDRAGMVAQVTVDNNKTRSGRLKTTQISVLASPVSVVLKDSTGESIVSTVTSAVTVTKHTDATVAWTSQLSGGGAMTVVNGSVDFDSYGEQSFTITAQKELQLSDIQLQFTVAPAVAKFIVGMSHGPGVKLTNDTTWKWTNVTGDPMVWIGRIEAGFFLKLRGSGPDWEDPDFSKDYPTIPFIPRSWGGDQAANGQFGCNISANGKVIAYSGPRVLKAGETIVFQFDLAATPSKVLNMTKHFSERYYQISQPYHSPSEMKAKGVTVATLHQGCQGQVNVNGSAGPNLVNPYINYPFVPQSVRFFSDYVNEAKQFGIRTKFYYTIRELSNRAAELWALMSLQGEIYLDLPNSPWTIPQKGYAHDWDTHGGDVWLHEHVAEGYTPCWQNPLANGEMDGAMCDIGTSRWFNYYLEGLYWSVANPPHIGGVYYDGINFDRKSMRRLRKVIDRAAHDAGIEPPLLDFHTGQVSTSSSAVSFLSHFPYADSAWNGEGFSPIFAGDADGWLINFSGFQHGIAVDMLGGGSENGGAGDKGMLYKAMLFGASRRNDVTTPTLWQQVWDKQKLGESNMIGWWEDDPAATATLIVAPPPPPPPPPTPIPSPATDWKAYPNESFSGPNVTPCLCTVPTPADSRECTCELCCPSKGLSVLNITLERCEAACLGQGASTNHVPGKSCTAVNYDEVSNGCVYRAMGNGHEGAPATLPWSRGTGYAYMPKQRNNVTNVAATKAGAAALTKAQLDASANTALVTTFSLYGERAVFVVASWASQTARFNLTIDWQGLGLAPGSSLEVGAPPLEGWQNAVQLGDGTTMPSFELPAKSGLIVVASKVV